MAVIDISIIVILGVQYEKISKLLNIQSWS